MSYSLSLMHLDEMHHSVNMVKRGIIFTVRCSPKTSLDGSVSVSLMSMAYDSVTIEQCITQLLVILPQHHHDTTATAPPPPIHHHNSTTTDPLHLLTLASTYYNITWINFITTLILRRAIVSSFNFGDITTSKFHCHK